MERQPALYLSHGAPPLADDELWPGQLAAWSAALPRPTAILVLSAHWEEAPLALGATTTVPLVYDAYTDLTLALAAPLTAPIGILDVDGHGFCRFVLPGGTSPSFAGVVLHHAFVAVHPVTFELLVSNAVRVGLVP